VTQTDLDASAVGGDKSFHCGGEQGTRKLLLAALLPLHQIHTKKINDNHHNVQALQLIVFARYLPGVPKPFVCLVPMRMTVCMRLTIGVRMTVCARMPSLHENV